MRNSKARIGYTSPTSCKALALAIAIAACLPMHAVAAETQTAGEAIVSFSIPAGDLSAALEKFSTQSGIQAMYRQDVVAGKRANAVNQSLAPSAALTRMLEGTGVGWERVNGKTYVLKAVPAETMKKPQQKETKSAASLKGAAQEEVKKLDDVVVVGSRLGVSPVESAMPVKLITREQIDRSGAGNIAQVLSQLSEVSVNNNGDRDIGGTAVIVGGGNVNASTVQLRGLPRGTTLVLINGRRAGDSSSYTSSGQFDLSTIPLSLVERIEVLPAGSSAVYGGDGLSGVINIVLRRDANGLELRVRRTEADAYDATQVSAVWGKTWAKGDLTISASWKENDSLLSSERSLTSNQDYTRFGGIDWRIPWGNPATVYSLAGCPEPFGFCMVPLEERGNLPGLNSPVAVVPGGQNGEGLTPQDFMETQGQLNLASMNRHFFSAEKTYSLGLNGRVELASTVEVFTEWSLSKRSIPAYQLPFGLSYGSYGVLSALVPVSNPYNPFGVPVGVDYLFKDTGLFSSYSQQFIRGLFGFRGKTDRFDWELAGWKAKDKSGSGGGIGFDGEAIAAALASSDPSTAINPFVGDGGSPASQSILESLLYPVDHQSESETTAVTGFVRGRLASMPAGDLIGLAGLEYQKQSLSLRSNSPFLVVQNLGGDSSSRAVFAEMRLPLLSAREGQAFERIAMTGALRKESNDRFDGDALTKTIGFEARPKDSLLLRATYSTAFRPILAYNTVQEPMYAGGFVYDPKFDGAPFEFNTIITGGLPTGIKPETSSTKTIGAIYSPNDEWKFSFTHWDIQFRDQIAYIDAQTMVDNEAFYSDRIKRDPVTGFITEIDLRQININFLNTAGVDIGFDGQIKTRIGTFYPALSATYTYKYDEQFFLGAPIARKVSRRSSFGWAPRWKIVPRLSWDYDQSISGSLSGRYISRYRDSEPLSTGPNAGNFLNLGKFWVFDLNMNVALSRLTSQSLFSDSRLNFGVSNLLDKEPEFCAGCGAAGYDASQYDIMGRTIYAELIMSF